MLRRRVLFPEKISILMRPGRDGSEGIDNCPRFPVQVLAAHHRVRGFLQFAELGRPDAVQVIHQDLMLPEAAFFFFW